MQSITTSKNFHELSWGINYTKSYYIHAKQIARFFRVFATGPPPNPGPERVTRTLTGTNLVGHSRVRHRSCSVPDKPVESSTDPAPVMKLHNKARCPVYPRSEVKRCSVSDEKVPWSVPYEDYAPVDFTSDSVLKMPPWADIDFRVCQLQTNGHTSGDNQEPKWNQLDGKINRRSHTGEYKVVDNIPRNPVGRTGVRGRGCLGRWGPNHAADPIVTRWKRNDKGQIVVDNNHKLIAQFIAVQRRDNGQWALPGGMVDAGEVVTMTLRREFGEEALNSLEATEQEKRHIEASINELFSRGQEVFRGYVDDPRNTDNAWMETVAMNFHDQDGSGVARFKLHAGDDAVGVQWMDLSRDLELYASHIDFLQKTAEKLGASW